MYYLLDDNTEIDFDKVSIVQNKTMDILTGEVGLFVTIDGVELKVHKVQEFMDKWDMYKKNKALNNQRVNL